MNLNKSSHSLDQFNSIVEKGVNLNLSGMKVPDLQISSILYLNKGKFELIRHFG